jgi:hypothetical protein
MVSTSDTPNASNNGRNNDTTPNDSADEASPDIIE